METLIKIKFQSIVYKKKVSLIFHFQRDDWGDGVKLNVKIKKKIKKGEEENRRKDNKKKQNTPQMQMLHIDTKRMLDKKKFKKTVLGRSAMARISKLKKQLNQSQSQSGLLGTKYIGYSHPPHHRLQHYLHFRSGEVHTDTGMERGLKSTDTGMGRGLKRRKDSDYFC